MPKRPSANNVRGSNCGFVISGSKSWATVAIPAQRSVAADGSAPPPGPTGRRPENHWRSRRSSGSNRCMLDDEQVASFIANGFVRLPCAFPRSLAEECRAIIWQDLNVSPDEPDTWPAPVATRPDYASTPFVAAANTPRLHAAYDRLVGPKRWVPRTSLGGFVIRFPGNGPAVLDGWHVDASFPGPESSASDYLSWRVNIHSKNRALLMLFLFSDTS